MLPIDNVNELKATLENFHSMLVEETAEYEDYDGEADDLIGSVSRVNETLKNIEDMDQFKKLFTDFGWDFFAVFMALQEMSIEEEDFDMEDVIPNENEL